MQKVLWIIERQEYLETDNAMGNLRDLCIRQAGTFVVHWNAIIAPEWLKTEVDINLIEWNKTPNDPQWQRMGIKPLKDKWPLAPSAVSEDAKVSHWTVLSCVIQLKVISLTFVSSCFTWIAGL